MDEIAFEQYFEAIATQLKAIGHDAQNTKKRFFRLEEVWSGLKAKSDSSALLMVIKNEEGNISSMGNKGLTERHECTFMLLRKVKEGDFPAQKQAYADTLAAGRKILGRMRKDKIVGHPLMDYLAMEGASFQKMGPAMDGLYGYSFTFLILSKENCGYEYKEEDWAI